MRYGTVGYHPHLAETALLRSPTTSTSQVVLGIFIIIIPIHTIIVRSTSSTHTHISIFMRYTLPLYRVYFIPKKFEEMLSVLSLAATSVLNPTVLRTQTTLGRRGALGLLGLLPPMAANAARECRTTSNPSITVVTCVGVGIQGNGRLLGCDADEACVASGAISNPSKFSPPWVRP